VGVAGWRVAGKKIINYFDCFYIELTMSKFDIIRERLLKVGIPKISIDEIVLVVNEENAKKIASFQTMIDNKCNTINSFNDEQYKLIDERMNLMTSRLDNIENLLSSRIENLEKILETSMIDLNRKINRISDEKATVINLQEVAKTQPKSLNRSVSISRMPTRK
jgi:hypothetical protein